MRPSCTSTSSPKAWSRGRARRATSARARSIARGDAAAGSRRRAGDRANQRRRSTPRTRATSSRRLPWPSRRQWLRHRVGLHAGPVHDRADDRPHARAAAVAAQGRAAGSGRRLRRQDRHPWRGRGGAPGAEVRPAREDGADARGSAAGRLRPGRRRADRHRGRRRPGRPPHRHRGHLPPGCRGLAGPEPLAGDAGLGSPLPMPQSQSAGLRRRHQQAAHGGLSRPRRHPGGVRHGAGDGRAVPAAGHGPAGIPQAQRVRDRQHHADRHAVSGHRAHNNPASGSARTPAGPIRSRKAAIPAAAAWRSATGAARP